jgi:hypothetical protein
VYESPAYADDVKQLKEELLALKRTYGDDDEKYPELMRIRNELW